MSEWWQQTNEPEENKHTDGEAPRAEEPAATPEAPTEPAASPSEPDWAGQPTEPSAAQPQWQQQQPQAPHPPTPPPPPAVPSATADLFLECAAADLYAADVAGPAESTEQPSAAAP